MYNNPLIPGDPFMYDLKWIVRRIINLGIEVENIPTEEEIRIIAQSIIAEKNLNIINVKDYGAKGDGITDDLSSIISAYIAALDVKGTLYFPAGTYVIHNTFEMPDAINVLCEGFIYTPDAITAVKSGSADHSTDNITQTWRVKGLNALNTGSVGIELVNYNGCIVTIDTCTDFETGILFHGNEGGFNNNIIMFGLCNFNKNHVVLTNTGSGWCNENFFIGGRFGTSSSALYQATAITIDSNSGYYNNNNIFIKPNCERSYNAININYGSYNRFEQVRTEAVTIPVIISNDSVNNDINIGFGVAVTGVIPLNNVSNSNINVDMNYNDNTVILGDISSSYASISNMATANDIFCMNSGNIVNCASSFIGATKAADGALNIPANRRFGTIVTLNDGDAGKINFHVQIIKGTGGSDPRLFVVFFDSAGAIINTPPKAFSFTVPTAITLDGATGYYFANRSAFTFVPPENTAYFYCAVYTNTANIIKGFKLSANRPFDIWRRAAALPSIPTSAGTLNQIVKDNSGATNGWRYNGTSWVTI